DAYDHYGNNGRRVIGFAQKEFRAASDSKFSVEEGNFPFEELTFIGIAAIMDPPRPDTANAIAQCKHAGIKVIIHQQPLRLLAKSDLLVVDVKSRRRVTVNVPVEEIEEETDKEWATVHGKMLPSMSDDDWDELLAHSYIVFARCFHVFHVILVYLTASTDILSQIHLS
ncbi:unnamed protein product, partial [Anisakis simplex]|uniref:Cation transporting ATPase (inferred by orthology to a C. elegans protein) n=1 Tax=Anisakis simplex TaxID=6269 RepID=A0A0M3J9A8_ANISI